MIPSRNIEKLPLVLRSDALVQELTLIGTDGLEREEQTVCTATRWLADGTMLVVGRSVQERKQIGGSIVRDAGDMLGNKQRMQASCVSATSAPESRRTKAILLPGVSIDPSKFERSRNSG